MTILISIPNIELTILTIKNDKFDEISATNKTENPFSLQDDEKTDMTDTNQMIDIFDNPYNDNSF